MQPLGFHSTNMIQPEETVENQGEEREEKEKEKKRDTELYQENQSQDPRTGLSQSAACFPLWRISECTQKWRGREVTSRVV